MVIIDTPAHIQHVDRLENGVNVRGGTNYDLGRGGVSTPVVRMPDPVPVMPAAAIEFVPAADLERTPYEAKHRVPDAAPLMTLNFARNGVVLSSEQKKMLGAVKKGQRLIVVGHADPQESTPAAAAKERARVVSKQIKGSRIERAVSYADSLPLSANPFNSEKNRRVEVFVSTSKAR